METAHTQTDIHTHGNHDHSQPVSQLCELSERMGDVGGGTRDESRKTNVRRWKPGRGVHTPTEIGNLQLSLNINQKILRLDISVDHVFLVTIIQSCCQLLHILL